MVMKLNTGSWLVMAMVVTALTFVMERFVAGGSAGSLIVTMTFWLAISQGVVALMAASELSDGHWHRPFMRRMLGALYMIPVVGFLFVVQVTQLGVYPWIDEHGLWLNRNFFVARHLVTFLVVFAVARRFATLALEGAPRARFWGVVYLLLFMFHQSMVGFEWIMSLEKPWFSTLLGAWIAVGAFLSGICACALVLFPKRRDFDDGLRLVQKSIGGLMFGFSTFWAYFYFSQLIVIWYGNLPEEVAYLAKRIGYHTDYWALARLIFGMVWVVPFAVLLGRKPKIMPGITTAIALVILTGLTLEYWLLVNPAAPVNLIALVVEMGAMAFLFASVLASSERLLPQPGPAAVGGLEPAEQH